jgi:hypothetical protein
MGRWGQVGTYIQKYLEQHIHHAETGRMAILGL